MTYPEARLVRLPLTVPGMSSVDENGEPMIYLNDRLTLAQHLRTYEHELQHISRDDFFNDLPIEVVEKRTIRYDVLRRVMYALCGTIERGR